MSRSASRCPTIGPCRSASTAVHPAVLADAGADYAQRDPRDRPKALLVPPRPEERQRRARALAEGRSDGPPRPHRSRTRTGPQRAIAERPGRARAAPATARDASQRASAPIPTPSSRPHPPRVIAKLGPELFTARDREDLTERVLHAVTEQLALDRTPAHARGAPADRRARSRTTSSATGRSSRSSRDDSVTEVMVNGSDRIYVERDGKLERDGRDVRRQRPPAADHRQDRLAGRPPHRRVVADGRRPPAGRQPRQRDHPAARARRARRSRSGSSRATRTRWTT